MLTCAALNTEAMAATNALQQEQPEPFLVSLLFLHFFSSFLSSLFFFVFVLPWDVQ